MPIHRTLEFKDPDDAEFALVDGAVMRCAYATQNRFGRLFDERVYENDLAGRLRAEGFEVHSQVVVTVSHADFHKTWRLDLIVRQMLYEIKVVTALVDEHKAQALNYAMLQNVQRVKLLNFGGPKVEGLLLRNAVSESRRHQPMFLLDGWRAQSPCCDRLVGHLRDLIEDWGTHLSTQLYNEALIHRFGGANHCLRRLEIRAEDRLLGTHPVQMHSPDHAFTITALTANLPAFRRHLETLLSHTRLKAIQWINLNRSRIEITTLDRAGSGTRMQE